MRVLFKKQGVRDTASPRYLALIIQRKVAAGNANTSFSLIRTMTVGPGITPSLLTLLR